MRKVGVLGAGTMGSQIAAHLANAGIPTLLLDLPQEGKDRSALARSAIKALSRIKPPPLYMPSLAGLIEAGNFEDDLKRLGECDWVVEAVAERLDVKQQLWSKVEPHLRPGTIVSSNTSGLSIAEIANGRSSEFRRHWLGTHFFNPPRYMKLLEIIPGPDTMPEVIDRMIELGDRRLGKGIVMAKDKPNFVANRIGAFAASLSMHLTEEMQLTVEEVDALTGPIIGRPKTATYRLADLIGVDIMCHVSDNLFDNLPDDPWRDLLAPPALLRKMVEKGWNGRKSGQGFYKKQGSEFLVVDLGEMEYRSQRPVEIPSIAAASRESEATRRISMLIDSGDKSEAFLWPLLRDTFAYSAGLVGEICDHLYQIDRAMRWGWAWSHGPFELWDALGTEKIAARIRKDGIRLPDWVESVRDDSGFYISGEPVRFFDLASSGHQPLPTDPEVMSLKILKDEGKMLLENDSASLIDLGEGVACLEFHSKMNTIDENLFDLGLQAMDTVRRDFRAMVIANQGQNFSVGANLLFLLEACRKQQWSEIEAMIRRFQNFCQSLKEAPFAVVGAPFGQALGGGLEICLACDELVCSAESYMGLVEVGAGLIPSGGGCKELLQRLCPNDVEAKVELHSGVRKAFEAIGMAKVSASAVEARQLGFLRDQDQIEVSPDRLVYRAMQSALRLGDRYEAPIPQPIIACGESCVARIDVTLHLLHEAGYLTEYDVVIGRKLAFVLAGGDLNHPIAVGEQHFLDLEREAFLSLCGEERTQARMEHLLSTGKPLRN